ncbi:MAG TPA: hypothetical protein VF575_02495 [Candidatus Saccharimonadales bacterium]|jgi:hypothetical protein
MQKQLALPNIKTSLVAAAITVSAMAMMSGNASATSMPTSEHHGNSHVAMASHEDKKTHENKMKHENKDHGNKHQQSQAAIDLRVGLNNLLAEHVTTNLTVNRSIAGGASSAQIEAGMQAQLANSDALSAAVGSVYGAEAQAQFSEMFREHIVESNAYAQAVAAGDESAKAAANAELQEYLHELSTFFSTAIPGLPQEDVYSLLNQHEELINASTEAFKAGDYHQSYKLEHDALVQVATIADALADGIVRTQPDLF